MSVLVAPTKSNLMKDGIGAEYTREDHAALSNQIFSSYSRVQDVRSLAQIIGEDDLGDIDKLYLKFGRTFEESFVAQGASENRSIQETLDLGWKILSILPMSEIDRIEPEILNKYYQGKRER